MRQVQKKAGLPEEISVESPQTSQRELLNEGTSEKPPLGLLPPGIHDMTLDSLRALAVTNHRRRALWARFISFITWPALGRRFSYVYVGGAFMTSKPDPVDVDVVLQTVEPFGPGSFSALEPFFVPGIAQIREMYGTHLHFWMDGAPAFLSDFRAFFQYDRLQDEVMSERIRGVVRISISGSLASGQLKKQLESLHLT